ncbi:MAG: glycosyltransferase family 2 protein, partial [Alphaproteobacteria bacterium]|nr:glycosyltransferase family 2 protein [Alphaproteobacteria bacterium]
MSAATLDPDAGAARMRASGAQVTIGVPVFNGAAHLEECLSCLARQTHPSFLVAISDNASTDATAGIAAAWAGRDPRFIHVRQPENIGPARNFLWLRDNAASPYFMWRAYDDLSSDDYVARLAAVLDRDPRLGLAVGRVEARETRRGVERVRVTPYRAPTGSWRPLSIARGMRAAHQSWFYGLWRREAAIEVFDAVWAAYPHAWGSDHLTLDFLALEQRIGGDDAAVFVQRIIPGRGGGAMIGARALAALR